MDLHFNTDQGRATLNNLRQVVVALQDEMQVAHSAVGSLVGEGWRALAADQFLTAVDEWVQRFGLALEEMERLNQLLDAEILQWEEMAARFGEGATLLPPLVPIPPTTDEGATSPESEVSPPQTPSKEYVPVYDGKTPAPGTTKLNGLIDAPLQSDSSNRNSELHNDTINQFAVESNPRYTPYRQGNGDTYCNIFVSDVTRAMGAEVPQWVVENGKTNYLDANEMTHWLETSGKTEGWKTVTGAEAQAMASIGLPVIAAWSNPGGTGHMAMVRPGEYSTEKGPVIAQAGGRNSNKARVADTFGDGWYNNQVVYYVHP